MALRVIALYMLCALISFRASALDLNHAALAESIFDSVSSEQDLMTLIRIEPCGAANREAKKIAFFFRSAPLASSLLVFVSPPREQGGAYIGRGTNLLGFAPGAGIFFNAGWKERIGSPVLAMMSVLSREILSDYEPVSAEAVLLSAYLCYKVTFRSKNEASFFPRIGLWALRDSMIPIRAEYFNKQGENACTILFLKWVKHGSVHLPVAAVVKNNSGPKKSFNLYFENHTLARLPEFIFTRAYLEFMSH